MFSRWLLVGCKVVASRLLGDYQVLLGGLKMVSGWLLVIY